MQIDLYASIYGMYSPSSPLASLSIPFPVREGQLDGVKESVKCFWSILRGGIGLEQMDEEVGPPARTAIKPLHIKWCLLSEGHF